MFNKTILHIKDVAPLRHCVALAIESKPMIAARVVHLFRSCSPNAISRLVAFVVVQSFDHMFRRRTISHVLKERLKTVFPTLAHSDSSAAIMFPSYMTGIGTSLLHPTPNRVHRRSTTSMLQAAFDYEHASKTSTAFRTFVSQIVLEYAHNFSTLTFAFPSCALAGLVFQCREPSKYLACAIDKLIASFLMEAKFFLHNSVRLICATLPDANRGGIFIMNKMDKASTLQPQ